MLSSLGTFSRSRWLAKDPFGCLKICLGAESPFEGVTFGEFPGLWGKYTSFGYLRVRFGEFRGHFDFWSQLRVGFDLEKLGGHLGCLEVSMGAWITFGGESFGR